MKRATRRAIQAQVDILRDQADELERAAAQAAQGLRLQADTLAAVLDDDELPQVQPRAQGLPLSAEELTSGELLALLKLRRRQTLLDIRRKDPTFPRPRVMRGRNRWLRAEVDAWRASRPRAA